MALRQYSVTLGAGATAATTDHVPMTFLRIENTASNATVKYGTSALVTGDYAGTVQAEAAGSSNAVVIGPLPVPSMNLGDFYFLGTQNQVIHLTVITP